MCVKHTRHRLTKRGHCWLCRDLKRRLRKGGRLGGSASGACKARTGPQNARFRARRGKFRTWRPSAVTFAMFQVLLARLHKAREQHKSKPFLRLGCLPSWITVAPDIDKVMRIMNGTRFGHPDRFKDRVSKEIRSAVVHLGEPSAQAAVCIGVRYRQSPRMLAHCLAAAGRGGSFAAALHKTKRGFRTYRQTGLSDRALCRGTMPAAKACAASRPYPDWASLEDEVARQMRKHCRGHGLEHFSARQAAADLSQLPGWVTGQGPGVRPSESRVGPGAQAGHYLAEAAIGTRHGQMPATLPYQEQTEKCEYGKLVCRLNFVAAAAAGRYTPAAS